MGHALVFDDRQCKTETCLKNGMCNCSREFPRCQQPTNPCKIASCDIASSRCVTQKRTGTCPDNGNPCTRDVCQDGTCKHPNRADGVHCGASKVCHRGKCCTPNCAGKTCGPNGCGGICESCTAPRTCQGGRCKCPPETPDFCGGTCWPARAVWEARDPDDCLCCQYKNGAHSTDGTCDCCCSRTCTNVEQFCTGLPAGESCRFDEQCESNKCGGPCCSGNICRPAPCCEA